MVRYKRKDVVRLSGVCVCSFIVGAFLQFATLYISEAISGAKSIEWNGGKYRGDNTNGIPNGDGIFEKDGITYSGYWNNGVLKNGTIESDKYVYDGELNGTRFEGYGVCRYKDGRSYWGYWKADMKEGLGRFRNREGKLSFGHFKDGILQQEEKSFNVGERVYGIDVSRYQGIVNWQDLFFTCHPNGAVDGVLDRNRKQIQPVLFAIARSTQGAKIRDARFESNYSEAKRCGVIVGAYHFLTLNKGGNEQAQYFIDNTPLEKGDFPPFLDLENNGNLSDSEFTKIIPIAKEWILRVTDHYGVRPIIYTTLNIYRKFVAPDSELSKYDFWIANPGTERPGIKNCIMWQFSHHGKINGITDEFVDINLFYGNYTDLEKYINDKGIK